MSLLTEIEKQLKTVDEKVYYGLANDEKDWNYIVFCRNKTNISTNKTGKTRYYSVAVVREGYIEEDMEEKVISAMCMIPGMKLSQEPTAYNYVKKPNTNMAVEIMEMVFCKAEKMK